MRRDDDLRHAQGVVDDGAGGTVYPGTGLVPLGTLSALLEELAAAPEEAGAPVPEPEPGMTIGRFELVREIGRGGFGVVFEARDRKLDRSVAFKLVRPGRRADLRERRLQREAEAAARLSHDNIVALHDVGQSDYGPYLVLELLRGRTLHERLKDGPLEPVEALRIFHEVARGVAHAHGQGVIHRDLKPTNVFLCEDGRVKVLDFGLAHAFGQRGQSGGTPGYMPPEQRRQAPEDERTDVFALGVILHQLLAGSLPFEREKQAAGNGRAPTLEVPGAPALGELVGRMLEKDPLRRPRDAGRVLSALERAMAGMAPVAPGPVRARRHPRWRMAALVAAGAALGLGGLLAWDHLRRLRSGGERIPVAVADVVNETGEKDLDVLSGLLVTSLEQSRRLAVLTQSRVLDLAAKRGRKDATRVDEAMGREVGKERGVRALLLPAVRRLGTTYAVEMRAVDPVRDEHLFTVSDRATSKEGLLDLLDRLSDRTRRELKEDEAELERSRIALGVAMTRSLEAYQHYLAGTEALWRDGRRAEALEEMLAAVALDPQFAAAHERLRHLYDASYGRPDLAAPEWSAAMASMDRMPEKERTLLRMVRAVREDTPHTDEAEALRLADELVARYPEDKYVLQRASAVYSALGRRDKAEASKRRILDLDPGHLNAAATLGDLLRDRPSARLEVVRRAVASRRNGGNLVTLAATLLEFGEYTEALALAREALRVGPLESGTVGNGCHTLVSRGHADECFAAWRRIVAEGLNGFERDIARHALVELLAHQGRLRQAKTLLGSVEEARRGDPRDIAWILQIGRHRTDVPDALAQVPRMEPALRRRWHLAFYGKVEEARRITASLPERDVAQIPVSWRVDGFMLASEGRLSEAADAYRRLLDEARRRGDVGVSTLQYLLAEALLAAGRPEEAAAVEPLSLEEIGNDDRRSLAIHAANYPRLALVRARALEQLGRRAEAVKELDGLLAFWKEADDDLPLLVEAKAMRKRLAAAPGTK